ncbi:DUF6308 family protein [Streptomyces sp. ODS05-4]|uniref:DUF6308 family protein n=1 Tax=Streptomyces sp. ODS05-4 TaxID=2944939 RepID=UPI00210BE933|nr:DUF6308 family protein [Streptomyces sp. ODS05-4]
MTFEERLWEAVTADRAVADLREYYDGTTASGAPLFTGSRFEHLGGGGDRPGAADTVTADDLIAVQTLSVQVHPEVALDLLEGDLGRRLARLLGEIPTGLDLAAADAAHVDTSSPAEEAWALLEQRKHIGWVTAGKLLARKRPRLLPVYDQVVRCAVGRPGGFWLALRDALRADDLALHHALTALRRRAELPETVSALRVLDVVLWTGHRHDHSDRH